MHLGIAPLSIRIAVAVAASAVATGAGLLIGHAKTTVAALVYLLAVLVVAFTVGLLAGVVSSILSFVGLNFYFTPPRRTLRVDKADDLIALVVFISVGVVVSSLVARSSAQRARAERREYESRSLYGITTTLLTGDLETACRNLVLTLQDLFQLRGSELRTQDRDGTWHVRASIGDKTGGHVRVPLLADSKPFGAIDLWTDGTGFGDAEQRVATVFAHQIASALVKADLEAQARESRMQAEADRMRGALLSSIGHEFRTPLASIKAAVTALEPAGSMIPDADRVELLVTAVEEIERLERLVANLLDTTRIRAGALSPERRSVAVTDVIEDALAGLRKQLTGRAIDVVCKPDCPVIDVDPVLVGQAITNIVENALKYAPGHEEVRIVASRWRDDVELRVIDRGPGIPQEERSRVFDEFYRRGETTGGTGLGLFIARAFVRATGGDVVAEGAPGGGTAFVLRLPGARA